MSRERVRRPRHSRHSIRCEDHLGPTARDRAQLRDGQPTPRDRDRRPAPRGASGRTNFVHRRLNSGRHSDRNPRSARPLNPLRSSPQTLARTRHRPRSRSVRSSSAIPRREQEAVAELSFAVPPGEICVLIGSSGRGKTTALKMVNRLISITEGDITIDGQSVHQLELTQVRRRIGYVSQQIGVVPHLGQSAGEVWRRGGTSDTRSARPRCNPQETDRGATCHRRRGRIDRSLLLFAGSGDQARGTRSQPGSVRPRCAWFGSMA